MTVARFKPELRTLLQAIHRQQEITGLEEFARSQAQGTRTIYRWHRALGDRLQYYPHLTFGTLGLEHLHLFLATSTPAWERYAIDAAWLVTAPGEHVLYLHCLIPITHRAAIEAGLAGTLHVWSGDGWQAMSDLHASIDDEGRPREHDSEITPTVPSCASPLLAQQPLALPVIGELLGARRSMDRIWRRIYDRLGERVWQYLPRRTRRWRHNGKTYVRRTVRSISDAGLVRQHIIRYQPLHEHTVEIFLHTEDPNAGTLLDAIGRVAPLIERYPTAHGYLIRVLGDHHVIKRLTMTTVHCQWWFASDERAPTVRFHYEDLFDPNTGWVPP